MAERLTKKQRREQTQAKIAAMRAAQARKERMRRVYVGLAAVLTVVVIVGVLVVVKVVGGGSSTPATPSTVASDAVVNALGDIPAQTFDTVAAGTVTAPPKAMTGAEAITADGKPRVLYVGAEYCPFCAAERWAMVAALSRFGSFGNLGATTSAPAPEVYPSTSTLSFHGSTYTSSYLSFTGYEQKTNKRQGNSYQPLDTLPAADQALLAKYDNQPYVSSDSAGAIPFVDIGGKYVISGASYDPQVLKGKTQEQIAQALSDPTSAIAKAVDGSANVITAALCQLTKDQPTAVCTSAGVKAGAAKLGNAP